MTEHYAASPFVAEWRAIEAMLSAGEPFAEVEAAIERAPLDDDQRSALWLAGWVKAERSAVGIFDRHAHPAATLGRPRA